MPKFRYRSRRADWGDRVALVFVVGVLTVVAWTLLHTALSLTWR